MDLPAFESTEAIPALKAVAAALYSITDTPELDLSEVLHSCAQFEPETVAVCIDRLCDARLLKRKGEVLKRVLEGKTAYEEDCVAELIYGEPYIINKCRSSIFHIVVEVPTGDERAGSGFLVQAATAERGALIATADHVLRKNLFKRLESCEGHVICDKAKPFKLNKADLDIAILELEIGVQLASSPLRVELARKHDQRFRTSIGVWLSTDCWS